MRKGSGYTKVATARLTVPLTITHARLPLGRPSTPVMPSPTAGPICNAHSAEGSTMAAATRPAGMMRQLSTSRR